MNFLKLLSVGPIVLALYLLVSCSSDTTENKVAQTDNTPARPTEPGQNNNPAAQPPQINSDNIEVKVFEVKDSTGKAKGWGYDIYVDKKKMIHQPIIPAVPGNDAFKTEKDALKTGTLAADKMKKSGSLPTITVNELDSLGVIKK